MVSNAFAAVDNISITHTHTDKGDAESSKNQLFVLSKQSQTNYCNNVEK